MSNSLLLEELVDEIDYSQIVTEDDAPVDNILSEREMILLIDALYASWLVNGKRPQFIALADVGIFYMPSQPPVVPDVFVSLDVSLPNEILSTKDKSYFIWQYGKPPEVVVEIVSNTKGDELGGKRTKYAQLGVSYYIVHDPLQYLGETKLHVFERHGAQFVRMSERWLPSVSLGVTLWQGEYKGMTREWLRWVDEDGNMLLTADEAVEVERAEAEAARERADVLAAKLRELGIDPELL